ncbi:hypothetical protein [Streptomyces hebeiensis]|uniref:hypothetical protein n=1 Tax=Streptomyces hebeiensis TaxID=229486 RepID=UPI0031D44191
MGLKVQQVTLRQRMRLIVVCGKADPDRAREAFAASIEQSAMRRDWMVWGKKAEVRVAVPVAEPLREGRLYTFLPMGEQVAAPVRGFVHGPFFAEMNRRSFNEAVPWNGLLLDTVTCARAVLATADGRAPVPAGALVDLMCWRSPTALTRLTSAFQRLGHGIAQVPFIPVIATAAGTRTFLHRAVLWEGKEHATAFTPHAVAATGVTDLLDPELLPVRLRSPARSVGTRLEPRSGSPPGRAARRGRRPRPLRPRMVGGLLLRPLAGVPRWLARDRQADHPHVRVGAGTGRRGRRLLRPGVPAGRLPSGPARRAVRPSALRARGHRLDRQGPQAQGRTRLRTADLVHDYGADQVLDVVAAALSAGGDDDGAPGLPPLRLRGVPHTGDRGAQGSAAEGSPGTDTGRLVGGEPRHVRARMAQ